MQPLATRISRSFMFCFALCIPLAIGMMSTSNMAIAAQPLECEVAGEIADEEGSCHSHTSITICHADNGDGNGNGYWTAITVDESSIVKGTGHGSINGNENYDIIPAFDYWSIENPPQQNTWVFGHYDGKNLGTFTRDLPGNKPSFEGTGAELLPSCTFTAPAVDFCPATPVVDPEGTDCDAVAEIDACPATPVIDPEGTDCDAVGGSDACPETVAVDPVGTDCDEIVITNVAGSNADPTGSGGASGTPTGTLPFTGIELPFMGLFGLVLITVGGIIRRATTRSIA